MKAMPNESSHEHYLPDFMTRSIGKSIRRMRKEQDLTLEALAQRLHITEEALSQIEQGKAPLDIRRADEIAQALGTTSEELLMRGESIYVGGDVSESNIGSQIGDGNNRWGVSEEALNNLTAALNRICDMLDKRLK